MNRSNLFIVVLGGVAEMKNFLRFQNYRSLLNNAHPCSRSLSRVDLLSVRCPLSLWVFSFFLFFFFSWESVLTSCCIRITQDCVRKNLKIKILKEERVSAVTLKLYSASEVC